MFRINIAVRVTHRRYINLSRNREQNSIFAMAGCKTKDCLLPRDSVITSKKYYRRAEHR